MFTFIDLLTGAIGIRLMRKYKKIRKIPDVVFVKPYLAFGGYTFYEDLKKMKIDTIIDLRAEVSEELIEDNTLDYFKIGIIDGSVPSEDQINYIHKIIFENERRKKIVFIHCNLGRGRATLAIMSYLLVDQNWDTVLKKVRLRRFVYLNKIQINFLKKMNKIE